MEDIVAIDHRGLTVATSGDHIPGKTGFIAYAASADLTTSPSTGSLAYTSDTGEFLVYLPTSEWGPVTTYWSRTRKQLTAGAGLVLADNTWTKIPLSGSDSTTYDTMSEYATGSSRWTALDTGYYLVIGNIRFPTTSDDYYKAAAVYQGGSPVSISKRYGSGHRNVYVIDILYVTVNDYLEFYGFQDNTDSEAVTAHSAGMNIMRLS